MRGGGRSRGGLRLQIEALSRLAGLFRRIHQAVAAHPHLIVGPGQVWQHVAAPIVSDHRPGELRRERRRLGNDPDARFRTVGPGDYTADVVRIDCDRASPRLRLTNQRCADERA